MRTFIVLLIVSTVLSFITALILRAAQFPPEKIMKITIVIFLLLWTALGLYYLAGKVPKWLKQ